VYAIMLPGSPFLGRLCAGGTTLAPEGGAPDPKCTTCTAQEPPLGRSSTLSRCCCGQVFRTRDDLLANCPAHETAATAAAAAAVGGAALSSPAPNAGELKGCAASAERLHAVVFVEMGGCGQAARDNPSWPLPHAMRAAGG
jgi:hypothetical protein